MLYNVIYYADAPWLGDTWEGQVPHRKYPERAKWRVASGPDKRLTRAEISAMKPAGATYWTPPLRLAMKMEPKPDLIWLLSDGDAADRRGLLKRLDRLTDGKVRINTIGMENGGEPFQALVDIANKTGGSYSIIMQGKRHSGQEALRFTSPEYGTAEN